mmetsp:Transcript_51009/g.122724  ORF Transcript_51009/g.122724 Transcript_51009/m.122724 type:complete len:337 (-) Transcript_51009:281-1291(-)
MPSSAPASCLPHAAADARWSAVKSTADPPTVSMQTARCTWTVVIFGRSASARASAASFSAASRAARASSSSSSAGASSAGASSAAASSPSLPSPSLASLAAASASARFASSAAAFSASSAAYLASASNTAATSASLMAASWMEELNTTGTAKKAPSLGILCIVMRGSCSTCETCTVGYSGGGTSFLGASSSSSSPSSGSGTAGSFQASKVTPLDSVLPTIHEWSSVACVYTAVSPPPSSSSSPPPAPGTRLATYTPAAPVQRCSAPSSEVMAPLVSLPSAKTLVRLATTRSSAAARSCAGLSALALAAAATAASRSSTLIWSRRAASSAVRLAAST